MLTLTRSVGETIRIGDDIEVHVVEVRGGTVRLGFKAPREVTIHREEVYRQIAEANLLAAQVTADTLGALAAFAPQADTPGTPAPGAPAPGPRRPASGPPRRRRRRADDTPPTAGPRLGNTRRCAGPPDLGGPSSGQNLTKVAAQIAQGTASCVPVTVRSCARVAPEHDTGGDEDAAQRHGTDPAGRRDRRRPRPAAAAARLDPALPGRAGRAGRRAPGGRLLRHRPGQGRARRPRHRRRRAGAARGDRPLLPAGAGRLQLRQ
nr:carbon storage regulator CsrA [Geodermatophilus normandii]